jgi:heme A synthase
MSRFARFSWAILAVLIFVIVWGSYVRASGSGAGCGSHWPTCNGEIVPHAKSVKTLIELTHRLTSALSGLFVLVQLVWAFRAFPKRHRVRLATGASMFFMLTEGAVGAMLVRLELVAKDESPMRALVVAVHLVNTFLLVATVALAAFWASGGPSLRLRGQGAAGLATLVTLGATLVLGASGAVTALGDTLFPSGSLREGLAADFVTTAHFLVKLRVWHPVIGLTIAGWVLFVGGFVTARRPAKLVRTLAITAGVLFGAQVAFGFVNLAFLAPIPLQMGHLVLADAVWIALVLLAAATHADEPQTAEAVPS